MKSLARLPSRSTSSPSRLENVLEPDQAIDVEDVLRAYPAGTALALGVEKDVGTIAPGKQADLVVLSENPVDVDAERIDEIQVLQTYRAGRLAFSRN